jgi:hypothetical protein
VKREEPALSTGKSGEIRTHEPLRAAGFQDARRLVSQGDGRGRDERESAETDPRMGQAWVRRMR